MHASAPGQRSMQAHLGSEAEPCDHGQAAILELLHAQALECARVARQVQGVKPHRACEPPQSPPQWTPCLR